MIKNILSSILISFCPLLFSQPIFAQNSCELVTKNSVENLTKELNNNNYNALETSLKEIENSCGPTELTQRIRIVIAIINKQDSKSLIENYLDNKFDEKLDNRWTVSSKENYSYIYESDRSKYNFVALRHPIDQLIKTRAIALLQSQNYTLNNREIDFLNFFSNDELIKQHKASQETVYETTNIKKAIAKEEPQSSSYRDKSKMGYVASVGVYGPLGGTNTTLGYNPTFGFTLLSTLNNKFIYEGGLKFRINSNDRDFVYRYQGDNQIVNSNYALFIGGALGYKIFDNDKVILIPKFNIGADLLDTGISEEVYNDGYYDASGYYIAGGNSVKNYTVNTIHLGLTFTSMFHLKRRNYIGFEASYHYTPYQMDDRLQSSIYNHYCSFDLFFRF